MLARLLYGISADSYFGTKGRMDKAYPYLLSTSFGSRIAEKPDSHDVSQFRPTLERIARSSLLASRLQTSRRFQSRDKSFTENKTLLASTGYSIRFVNFQPYASCRRGVPVDLELLLAKKRALYRQEKMFFHSRMGWKMELFLLHDARPAIHRIQ